MQTSLSLARKYISWLKKSEGVTLSDNVIIFFIKLFYLGIRVPILIVGKKRSNRLLAKKD
jgi:hypothetical protein